MNLRTTEIAKRIYSFSNSAVGGSYGPLASRLAALRRYGARLDQSSQAYQILGSLFSADSSIVSDEILDLPASGSLPEDPINAEIDSDTFSTLDDCLSDVSNILHNVDAIDLNVETVTITDGDGISYSLSRNVINTVPQWVWNIYSSNGVLTEQVPFLFKDGSKYYINNVIPSLNEGKYVKTITAWLNSCAIVSTINNITNSIVNLCTKGAANVTSIFSTLSTYTTSSIASVKRWANTYLTIFNEAGLSGVVNYILRNVNKIGNDLIDDDGVMQFTNNDSLIPQEFIGTMIGAVAQTVGALMLAFGGVVVKIIGAALTGIGAIVSWFSKTAWGNYNSETLAGLIDTDESGQTVVLPEAPHAMVQFEITNYQLLPLFENNSGILIVDVPGGFLHIGPSGKEHVLRMEFHPHAFWTFNNFNCDYWLAIPKNSGTNTNAIFAVPKFASFDATGIEDKWANGYDIGAEYTMQNNWNSEGLQVFDAASDLKLRTVIMRNTGLFILWLSGINLEYNDTEYSLPISTQLGSGIPDVAYELSDPGSAISFKTTSFFTPVIYALTPLSLEFHAKYGINGSDASDQLVPEPSWQNIGNWFSNCHSLKSVEKSKFITTNGQGNNVLANYYITSGQIYPLLGENFLEANPSSFSSYSYLWLSRAMTTCGSVPRYMGDADFVTGQISSGVYSPKYNRETYWLWVGVVAATVVVIAAVTVVASLKIRKAIATKRAKNAAQVESAWANLVNNPNDPAAAQNYYKTVKKANLWAKVVGGTSFDASNYWTGGNSDAVPSEGKLSNFIAGYNETGSTTDLIQQVYRLIKTV